MIRGTMRFSQFQERHCSFLFQMSIGTMPTIHIPTLFTYRFLRLNRRLSVLIKAHILGQHLPDRYS